MSPELTQLLDELRWLSEMPSYPRLTLMVESSAGGRGSRSVDRDVLVEMLDLLLAAPRPEEAKP